MRRGSGWPRRTLTRAQSHYAAGDLRVKNLPPEKSDELEAHVKRPGKPTRDYTRAETNDDNRRIRGCGSDARRRRTFLSERCLFFLPPFKTGFALLSRYQRNRKILTEEIMRVPKNIVSYFGNDI